MQGKCTPATSAVAADHLVRLLKDRTAVIAAEEPGKAAKSHGCPIHHGVVLLTLQCSSWAVQGLIA